MTNQLGWLALWYALPKTYYWSANLFTLGEGGSLRISNQEEDTGLGYKTLELMKFKGAGGA